MTHLTIITPSASLKSDIYGSAFSSAQVPLCIKSAPSDTGREKEKQEERDTDPRSLCLFVKARSICSETKGWMSKATQLTQQTDDVLQVDQAGSGF